MKYLTIFKVFLIFIIFFINYFIYITELIPFWINNIYFPHSKESLSLLIQLVAPPDSSVYIYASMHNQLKFMFYEWGIINTLNYGAIGPVMAINLVFMKLELLPLLYILILFYFSLELFRYTNIKPTNFILLLIINPLVLFSFFGPNKEIAAIFAILFAALYSISKQTYHLIIAIFIGFLSKIQIVLLIFVFFIFCNYLTTLKKNFFGIFFIIFLISLFYEKIPGISERILIFEQYQDENSLGLTALLLKLSQNGFNVLAMVPRFIIALTEGHRDLFSFSFVQVHLLPTFISGSIIILLLCFVIKKKLFCFNNNLVTLFILYSTMASSIPFISHRYFLPLYGILLITYLRKNN